MSLAEHRQAIDRLDEQIVGLLNERTGLETPTLENLCLHFAQQLKPRFSGLSRIAVSRPSVGESCALTVGD